MIPLVELPHIQQADSALAPWPVGEPEWIWQEKWQRKVVERYLDNDGHKRVQNPCLIGSIPILDLPCWQWNSLGFIRTTKHRWLTGRPKKYWNAMENQRQRRPTPVSICLKTWKLTDHSSWETETATVFRWSTGLFWLHGASSVAPVEHEMKHEQYSDSYHASIVVSTTIFYIYIYISKLHVS